MASIPYADLTAPAVQPLVQQITAQRGSVLHLYQMLLHSPPLAEGWLGFMTQVRQKLALPGSLRELVIMRIAHINGAPYEADQHAPIALQEGLSPQQLAALPQWETQPQLYTALQQAALVLCDTMTRHVQVPAPVLQAVHAQLLEAQMGDQQLVELVATIASYNMVSRFLEALHIHSSDAAPGH
jgi:AhpD family alkylhydroperoxidase